MSMTWGICVTWRCHMCDVTRLCVWRDCILRYGIWCLYVAYVNAHSHPCHTPLNAHTHPCHIRTRDFIPRSTGAIGLPGIKSDVHMWQGCVHLRIDTEMYRCVCVYSAPWLVYICDDTWRVYIFDVWYYMTCLYIWCLSCSLWDQMSACVMSVCVRLRIDTEIYWCVCICSATWLVYMSDVTVLLGMRSDVLMCHECVYAFMYRYSDA